MRRLLFIATLISFGVQAQNFSLHSKSTEVGMGVGQLYGFEDQGAISSYHKFGSIDGQTLSQIVYRDVDGSTELSQVNIAKIPPAYKFEKYVATQKTDWVLVSSTKGERTLLEAWECKDGKFPARKVNVFSSDIVSKKDVVEYLVDVSDNGRNIACFFKHTKKKGELEKYEIRVFDDDMLPVWKKMHLTHSAGRKSSVNDILVTDYRDVFMVQRSEYKKYYKCFSLMFNSSKSQVKDINLHVDGISPTNYVLKTDADQNVVIAGYYSENQIAKKSQEDGVFYYKIFDGDQKVMKSYSKFPEFSCGTLTEPLELLDVVVSSNGETFIVGQTAVEEKRVASLNGGGTPGNEMVIMSAFSNAGTPGVSDCFLYNRAAMKGCCVRSFIKNDKRFVLTASEKDKKNVLYCRVINKKGRVVRSESFPFHKFDAVLLKKGFLAEDAFVVPCVDQGKLAWLKFAITD